MIPACAHEANQGRSTRGALGDRLGDRMLEGDPVDPSSRLVQFTTGHSAARSGTSSDAIGVPQPVTGLQPGPAC